MITCRPVITITKIPKLTFDPYTAISREGTSDLGGFLPKHLTEMSARFQGVLVVDAVPFRVNVLPFVEPELCGLENLEYKKIR